MRFNNSYARLDIRLYNKQQPVPLDLPRAGHFNPIVAEQIGWHDDAELMENWVGILAGHYVPDRFEPLAMAYAGHQFGHWAGQLGDGRGLLMTQVIDKHGKLTDLHLKGAGLTPYSRMGDGRAVLRSTIREYLCGHAMSSLGIASSNALGFVTSNTSVQREKFEQGAALMRVADTHIRLGHVEWVTSFAPELLPSFTEYMIETYYPEVKLSDTPVLDFIGKVIKNTAEMIADWQLVGFAHGVMNTDNLSITGSTLDYGPFGFLERFNPAWINNHSDHTGRYAYQNQPSIGHWNLNIWMMHFMQLSGKPLFANHSNKKAESITRDGLSNCLVQYENHFIKRYQHGLCAKLGLTWLHLNDVKKDRIESNTGLISKTLALGFDFLEFLESNKLDYTNSFRSLAAVLEADTNPYESALLDILNSELDGKQKQYWQTWQHNYVSHIKKVISETDIQIGEVIQSLKASNPAYILRNAMVQHAIEAAERGCFNDVDRLFKLLSNPYLVQDIAVEADITPLEKGAIPLVISCSS